MPKKTPQGQFPFDKAICTVELWERGNAPDYSIVYDIGKKAGHGATESYQVRNSPKGDPINYIEITGNSGSDIMKYNYMYIDFANVGDGKKAYFITSKKILNYPDRNPQTNQNGAYCIGFSLALDYWETYKDKLNSPQILLSQVTTNNPEGWNESGCISLDSQAFNESKISMTERTNSSWKKVIAWQAKKPNSQDNFIIDGMVTPLQYSESMDDYKSAIEDLASSSPEETNIWKTYVTCNSFIVTGDFTTENGGESARKFLNLATPKLGKHGRLNYYPYRRAFIRSIDGQCVELTAKNYVDDVLPDEIQASVFNSITPTPHSYCVPFYTKGTFFTDMIVFNAYPSMDITGKNITPTGQIMEEIGKGLSGLGRLPK